MSRKKWVALFAGTSLVLLVVLPFFHAHTRSKLTERWEIVNMKLAGELPGISWSDVGFAVLPTRMLSKTAALERGVVRRVQRDRDSCPSLWETPLGRFWGRDLDKLILQQLMVEQLHYHVYEHSGTALRAGDVVLDVGAHLGVYSRLALERSAARVVAIEPEPVNVACLKKTFAGEIASGRVVLVPAAAWDSDGTLTFHVRNNSLIGSAFFEKGIPVEVPTTTIDRMVERNGLDRVDFIKMDIEGAERNALRGAAQTLARFKPRMAICVYHREDDPTVIPQIVLSTRSDYAHGEHGRGALHVMFFF